jgi:hypothetical protein
MGGASRRSISRIAAATVSAKKPAARSSGTISHIALMLSGEAR